MVFPSPVLGRPVWAWLSPVNASINAVFWCISIFCCSVSTIENLGGRGFSGITPGFWPLLYVWSCPKCLSALRWHRRLSGLSFSCYCGRYPFVVPRISATACHQYFLFWWRQLSSPKPGFQLCRAVSWLFRCCARGPSLCSLPRLLLLMVFSKVPRSEFIAVRVWMRCCDGFKGCLGIGG